MRQITLITGGSRSGKSGYALQLAGQPVENKLFIATGHPWDEEMRQRIRRHREERVGLGWDTVEEAVDLAGVLRASGHRSVILVDCLTLWISNLLMHEGQNPVTETRMADLCQELVQICRDQEGQLLLIGNEVGMGIVPENVLARRFRDLSGRCHQVIAAQAQHVVLMVAGLPLWVKKTDGSG